MYGSRNFACSSLVALGGLLWLLSLMLPAISLPGSEAYRGVRVLLEGWRSVRYGIPAWCANPAFVVAVVLVVLKRHRSAALVSGLSLILAASSGATQWIAARIGTPLPSFAFEPGVVVWIGATAIVFAGTCCAVRSPARASGTSMTQPPRSRD